mmetsp:Transcript_23416/g.38747  ORF Transcript_23416/g.38747 Transcript_23416/m.38747 type:complete len:232 (+) Transcript_23416:54-749(+)
MSLIPSVPGVPALHWLNGVSGDAVLNEEGVLLTIRTGKETDWFNPPPAPSESSSTGTAAVPAGLSNAPALVFAAPPSTDWQFSALVQVNHQYLFDAGTLFLHQGANDWCKLCFEYSPEKRPLVVSVVTRDVSDDANGATIDGSSVYLRISKVGSMIAFHYALTNKDDNSNNNNNNNNQRYWTLHRAFCMRNPDAPTSIGFLAQAPTGVSCTAHFSSMGFSRTTLGDLRDGS